jgi:CHAT domain-containing protein
VVFAGPDYKLLRADRDQLVSALSATRERSASNPFSGLTSADTRSLTAWDFLAGTQQEAKDIFELLEGTQYGPVTRFEGKQALEDKLKAVHSPRILHIATHGFFLPEQPAVDASAAFQTPSQLDVPGGALGEGLGKLETLSRLREMENPLLRSGLVLAGADTSNDEPADATGAKRPVDDGWLTAEEISTLDLRGTELVVLSACETGLGDVQRGEGIQGLRSALLYAGAGTIVNSLFRVSDRATSELMHDFYAALNQQHKKLSALHVAQLKAIARGRATRGSAHPYYWGSFVLVGDPN